MLPSETDMMFCIVTSAGELADGANGIAIGETEQDAWDRLCDGQDWAINRCKDYGYKAKKCAIMLINP